MFGEALHDHSISHALLKLKELTELAYLTAKSGFKLPDTFTSEKYKISYPHEAQFYAHSILQLPVKLLQESLQVFALLPSLIKISS